MINYIEKGNRMNIALSAAGLTITAIGDGTEFIHKGNATDAEINTFILNYKPLPEAKKDAEQRIKLHAATLVHNIYPFVDAEKADVIGFYNYTIDMWQGGALPSRLQELKAVRDTAIAKIVEVNLMTDWQSVDAHDVTVGW